MDQATFENLIKEKYESLSAGQKKVAEFLIDHLEEAAFSTAGQIGRKVDMSETTVIRLSYALGFNGFSEMQEKIQSQIRKNHHLPYASNSLDSAVNTDDELRVFSKVVEKDIQIMRETLHQLNVEDLWKVVDALVKADKILVAGYRLSYTAAYWFSFMLGTLRENVELCPPIGDVYEKLCNLTDRSVVFVISFPRYAREAVHIAECAKQQGATLLCVTDRMLSPVGRLSDIALTTEENLELGSNSISPVISLLDLIIIGMNLRDKERIQLRQQRLEKMYSSHDVFIE
ncbi:MurR/RpiR family transcriptional regulator [Brevibacillus sp. H7]|uniref:MurR/RpiR family transcriptional regulator n=1 Tax=Brevibacillus sp. H7 TaxID=3349138 RepID=UPI0037F528F8